MRSYIAKWRQRHADARHDRQIMRALEEVPAGTVREEVRAIALGRLRH
ncbi:MAG TPA: hypothetical protein VEL73_03320 [Mycobacteriales bacterium]|nr:hypothetical protein [Mycobacteriales bacterium]